MALRLSWVGRQTLNHSVPLPQCSGMLLPRAPSRRPTPFSSQRVTLPKDKGASVLIQAPPIPSPQQRVCKSAGRGYTPARPLPCNPGRNMTGDSPL